MFGSLRSFILAMAIAGLVLAMTHYGAYRAGKTAEKAVMADAVVKAEQRARDAEQAMQAAANEYEKAKRDEIDRVDSRYRTLLDRLRQRPGRNEAPTVTRVEESKSVCDGTGLSREDAEFLAGEAARANELRAELQACYQQYDKARELNNE